MTPEHASLVTSFDTNRIVRAEQEGGDTDTTLSVLQIEYTL